jgi:hypothetical protein
LKNWNRKAAAICAALAFAFSLRAEAPPSGPSAVEALEKELAAARQREADEADERAASSQQESIIKELERDARTFWAGERRRREGLEIQLGAVRRSLVWPGWGQFYGGAETRGWTYSGLFALSLTGALYFSQEATRARAGLRNAQQFDFLNLSAARGRYDRARSQATLWTGLAGLVWLVALGDAAFLLEPVSAPPGNAAEPAAWIAESVQAGPGSQPGASGLAVTFTVRF